MIARSVWKKMRASKEINSGKLAFTAFNVEQIQTSKQVARKVCLGNKHDL